jgi:hypothetical protein
VQEECSGTLKRNTRRNYNEVVVMEGKLMKCLKCGKTIWFSTYIYRGRAVGMPGVLGIGRVVSAEHLRCRE